MSNYYFNRLKWLVGEPTKTDRFGMGMSAAREDTFACGCQRYYIARMVGDHGEDEEKLCPCNEHKFLLDEAPLRHVPVGAQLLMQLTEES